MNALNVTNPPTPSANTRSCRNRRPMESWTAARHLSSWWRTPFGVSIANADAKSGEAGSNPERGIESIGADHRFADHRSDAETTEHCDREIARGLGAATGRREIADARCCGDEQRCLTDPLQMRARAATPNAIRSACTQRLRSQPATHQGSSCIADRAVRRNGRASAGSTLQRC